MFESTNTKVRLSSAYEDAIWIEIQFMQYLEDNLLLQDYLLNNKLLCSIKIEFYKIIKVFNKEMRNVIGTYAR